MLNLRERLQGIHDDAMGRFTYRSDQATRGVPEWWMSREEIARDLIKGHVEGDCDDCALLHRELCWDKGISNRLVYCTAPSGEGHLVCESEGWIMCNMQPRVEARQDLEAAGYRFISASGFRPGEKWTQITG